MACSVGSPKMRSGGPDSTMTPSSRKQTVLATSRAKAHLMGCDQHCHALVGEFSDEVEHLRDELRVERGGDLVEEQQPGAHRERPDDRDALLLAPREAVGELGSLVRQADPGEQLPGALLGQRTLDPRTRRGASVTLSSTLRWGKRLNDWNTIPVCRRTRSSSMRSSPRSWPNSSIVPESTRSSRLQQRSRVDFPDPEEPMRHTTSWAAIVEVDAPQHLEGAEGLVHTDGAQYRWSRARVWLRVDRARCPSRALTPSSRPAGETGPVP